MPFCNGAILNALCRSCLLELAKSGLEEELLLPERGLQMVEPALLGVVLREERTSHPIGVPTLKQLEDEDLFASDLGHAIHDDFAG